MNCNLNTILFFTMKKFMEYDFSNIATEKKNLLVITV